MASRYSIQESVRLRHCYLQIDYATWLIPKHLLSARPLGEQSHPPRHHKSLSNQPRVHSCFQWQEPGVLLGLKVPSRSCRELELADSLQLAQLDLSSPSKPKPLVQFQRCENSSQFDQPYLSHLFLNALKNT